MKYLEWVDAYLAGELPEAQQKEFEAALSESAELQEEVALTRKMVAALSIGPPDEATENLIAQIAERHRSERNALFQQYRTGTLSAAERINIEKQLAEDELLAFEWETYQKAHPVLKTKKVQIIWVRWMAAASIALMLGFFSWWMMRAGDNSEELVAKYDVPELFPHVEYALVNEGLHHLGIIGSRDFDSLRISGLEAFEAKNWDESIRLLSEYSANAKPSVEETPDEINLVNLYIGRAWFEKNETKKAIEYIQKAEAGVVDSVNYGPLRELMRWHLALALLKNNDVPAAKIMLKKLPTAQHDIIRQQAINLLNDLK